MTSGTAAPRDVSRAAGLGSGARWRSLSARARYNARVAVDLDRGTHRALRALLDASRGYTAAAGRLVVENPTGPGSTDAHGLCASLAGTPRPRLGAPLVALATGAIAHHLEQRAGLPPRVAGSLAEAFGSATGGAATVGGLPLAGIPAALVVLVCPDIRACATRLDALVALADPDVTRALESLDLPI